MDTNTITADHIVTDITDADRNAAFARLETIDGVFHVDGGSHAFATLESAWHHAAYLESRVRVAAEMQTILAADTVVRFGSGKVMWRVESVHPDHGSVSLVRADGKENVWGNTLSLYVTFAKLDRLRVVAYATLRPTGDTVLAD